MHTSGFRHVSTVFSFIALFSFPLNSFAQSGPTNQWNMLFLIKGTLSTKVWTPDFDKEAFQHYPAFEFRPGYGFSLDVHKNFRKKWYLKLSGEFAERHTAVKTGGYIRVVDNNGQLQAVQCKAIDQKIHQVLFHAGIGYTIFPWMSVEITPYVQADVTGEKYKVCDFTDWREDMFFEKAIDFGLSPAIRFQWKKWNAVIQYVHGFGKPVKIKLTDEIGADIGTYANQYRMISLGLGYSVW